MSSTTEPGEPPPLTEMFIKSSDTLRHREVGQVIPPEWNDRPPLFHVRVPQRRRFWRGPREEDVTEDEDPNLLKGMVRKGIPDPLRCAVWLSNIIQASYPHQDVRISHEYRTLAKVQVLDHAYQIACSRQHTSSNNLDTSISTSPQHSSPTQLSFGNTTIWDRVQTYSGKDALARVLLALSTVLGDVDVAPLIPTIAAILLGFMSESYVFCAIREMANHSTWFLATSQSEHVAYGQAFLDILGKLHPNTLETMREKGTEELFTQAIFQDFFVSILPERHVHRIMDIFTLEGTKALFRVGVALAVLYQREWKERYIYELETSWWDGLLKYCHSNALNFEVLVKKSYAVHGRGVRQRFRFPRRPIIARIIQLEEERYWMEKMQDSDTQQDMMEVVPLGLVPPLQPDDPDRERVVAKLAESMVVRTKLAEWLPLSLRFTKLQLIYSTNHHGRTLENLYRHVAHARRTIMLIEPISTKKVMVIGMFAPQTWHPSTRVYGDGSCFLFRIVEDKIDGETQCWKWHPKELKNLLSDEIVLEEESAASSTSLLNQSTENATALLEQFQVGTHSYISMGGNPNGTSGLRLNEDLTKGESSPASGFDNEPLAGDLFEVGLVEVYQMVREMDGRAVH